MARRRNPSLLTPILGIAVAAVLVLGAFLLIEGELTLFGRTIRLSEPNEVQAAELAEFQVRVPISTRGIPAFTRIQGEHVIDVASGRLTTIVLDSRTLPESVITETDYFEGRLRGRVLRRDKPAGRAFTESDFLPKGARDGISAGIPPGKRGLVLPAEQIQGLMDLRSGDRFDIVATWDAQPTPRGSNAGNAISFASSRTIVPTRPTKSRVEVVTDNGMVIRPVRVRQQPTTSTGLLAGQRISSTPVQEVQIAVTPDEAIRISAALQSGAVLRCLMRSGHPEDDGSSTTLPEEFLPKEEEEKDESVGEVMILRGGGEPERILTRRSKDPR